MTQKIICLVLMIICVGAVSARDYQQLPYTQIDAMQRMDIDGLSLIKSNGKLFLTSHNAHYVIIPAKIMDIWNGITIETMEDLEQSTRLPIDRILGNKTDALGKAIIGDGPPVYMFLDVAEKDTQNALRVINQLKDNYTFHLIFLPVSRSNVIQNQSIICNREAADKYIRSNGKVSIPMINRKDGCGHEAMQKNLVAAKVLGINSVITTIAPNGKPLVGHVAKLAGFINNNAE